ncbi:MAG: YkgJ family cysteine cluster protein [Gammaproteobacteria bacterium]|nr:YkgJ family cysteine cluster protein [Gammaproteobacteria bacterium]MCP5137033.1 YkgJ family cysteine cluster protein [Gammaproteobacteria bacterium]
MSDTNAYPTPQRLIFPADEIDHPWLQHAFNAYHLADVGVWKSIAEEERKGRKLACAKGCSNCCRSHTTIPLFPLELLGLYWFVSSKLDNEMRRRLKPQLENHQPGGACPFLLDGVCSVHPMRPLACRHFNVFGATCASGEDAFFTRREDVLTPIRSHQDAALEAMLPFHGITTTAAKRQAMQNGYLPKQAKVLQEIDWAHLAMRL